MTKSEHMRLHATLKSNLPADRSGEKNGMFGKGYLLAGEKNGMFGVHRYGEKAAHYGMPHSKESKKLMSLKKKGRHWFTNGIIEVMQFTCPEGFRPGKLPKYGLVEETA